MDRNLPKNADGLWSAFRCIILGTSCSRCRLVRISEDVAPDGFLDMVTPSTQQTVQTIK